MVRQGPSGSGGDNASDSDSRGSYGGGYTGGSFGDSSESDNISSDNDSDTGGASSSFGNAGSNPVSDTGGASSDTGGASSDSTPTRSVTRRSTVTESVFDSSGGTIGDNVDPALADSSPSRQVETASSNDFGPSTSSTSGAIAGAALAGVAVPEPASSVGGAAVLGGLAAGAVIADAARRSELEPSEFNPDIPELEPGQQQRNELEPGQQQRNELEPSTDRFGLSELGIGEQLNQPEITIGESTGGSRGTRSPDETVVPGEFPLPGRDIPADPSQEFVDRSPDPSDVVSSSTSTAVDSGSTINDGIESPTINDGIESPTIEEDEPGFDQTRDFPTSSDRSRINDETVRDPEITTQTTEITEPFSPTVSSGSGVSPTRGLGFGDPSQATQTPDPTPGFNSTPGIGTGTGTGTEARPEQQRELPPISAQATVDSGNQLANRAPQQPANPSLGQGQGQPFETAFNFNVSNRFRLRDPDDEDDDEEPDLFNTETDSSLFDSGISSGEEIADRFFD